MRLPICFQMSGVYCLLSIPELHESACIACAGAAEPAAGKSPILGAMAVKAAGRTV